MSLTDTPTFRCIGIIPAAGESRRMQGQHKLVLPWRNETVMDRVLRAWSESSVSRVIVIVRADNVALQKICRRWPNVELVIPAHDPDDMKRSVQLGLDHVAAQYKPHDSDRWMVAPADLPTLQSQLINQVFAASRDCDSIVVPRFGDRQGHPVSFPWSLAAKVFELEHDQGINHLVANHPIRWLDLPSCQHPDDIDTPADYLRLSEEQSGSATRNKR